MKAFSKIAPEWNQSRVQPLCALKVLLPYLPLKPSRVLDAGCGNGRNSIPLTKIAGEIHLLDSSPEMIELAKQNMRANGARNVEFAVGRLEKLPYKDGFFDAVLCIAALHHLRSGKARLAALSEVFRLLTPGGLLLATVWNRSQARFEKTGKNALIPWKTKGETEVLRYYHFFDPLELETLAVEAGFKEVKLFGEKDGALHPLRGAANLCLVAKKTVFKVCRQ